jgi:hypothetical protein
MASIGPPRFGPLVDLTVEVLRPEDRSNQEIDVFILPK